MTGPVTARITLRHHLQRVGARAWYEFFCSVTGRLLIDILPKLAAAAVLGSGIAVTYSLVNLGRSTSAHTAVAYGRERT